MRCSSISPNGGIRFTRKTTHENERLLFQSYWKEQTRLYGTFVDYFTYNYRLSAHDFIYGEHPTAEFAPPVGIVILAEVQNDSLMLAKFGIQTDADATFIIPIQTFRETFGPTAEPKSGDVIRMTELGWDRPGGVQDLNVTNLSGPVTACSDVPNPLDTICRQSNVSNGILNCDTDTNAYSAYDDAAVFDSLLRGAPTFEITERRDENMSMHYNMLQGHYVWIVHAKRFDYSYQPNAPREPGSDQVSDETIYGKLSGGTAFPENPKKYPQNIEDESNKQWDYDKVSGDDDGVYGKY
jgi:hypothetical protein